MGKGYSFLNIGGRRIFKLKDTGVRRIIDESNLAKKTLLEYFKIRCDLTVELSLILQITNYLLE